MSFQLTRGTNISHWLSQSERRGAARSDYFSDADVERIATLGFDHIRLPVDEVQLWDEQGRRHQDAFDLLDHALYWSERAGLRAVVDLHIIRSHYFNAETHPLFDDPAAQEHFCGLWRDLSKALRGWSNDQVAYELLNEPVAANDEDWNRLAERALATVREQEPERTVVIDSNRFSEPAAFSALRVPDDENLILTFHLYDPILFTHYRAPWSAVSVYEGPIDYPGELVSQEVFDSFSSEVRQAARGVRSYDIEAMESSLAPALELSSRTGNPLWCSEFGALTTTSDEARARWYKDALTVFARHGIPWTNWDYKGEFGIFDADGEPTLVHRVLTRFDPSASA